MLLGGSAEFVLGPVPPRFGTRVGWARQEERGRSALRGGQLETVIGVNLGRRIRSNS
jgi:hypothetical protein